MVDVDPTTDGDSDDGWQPGEKSLDNSQANETTAPFNFNSNSNFVCPPEPLASIGIIELLESDERPVFILDLASSTSPVVWNNIRFRELRQYNHETFGGDGGLGVPDMDDGLRDHRLSTFMYWARSSPKTSPLPVVIYCGSRWTAQTLRNRWRIIAAASCPLDKIATDYPQINQTSHPAEAPFHNEDSRLGSTGARAVILAKPDLKESLEDFRVHREQSLSIFPVKASIPHQRSDPPDAHILGPFDMLLKHPLVEHSSHFKQILAFDWASTPLGPITSWSLEMCQWVSFMMSDPRPVSLYWGPQRIMIYNEGYKIVTGQNEPGMMGQPFMEAWGDTAERFDPLFQQGYQTGIAALQDDAAMYLQVDGRFEETYFSFSIIPFCPVPGGEISL